MSANRKNGTPEISVAEKKTKGFRRRQWSQRVLVAVLRGFLFTGRETPDRRINRRDISGGEFLPGRDDGNITTPRRIADGRTITAEKRGSSSNGTTIGDQTSDSKKAETRIRKRFRFGAMPDGRLSTRQSGNDKISGYDSDTQRPPIGDIKRIYNTKVSPTTFIIFAETSGTARIWRWMRTQELIQLTVEAEPRRFNPQIAPTKKRFYQKTRAA